MVDTTGSCGCVMCWLHRTKTAPAWPKAVESVTLEAVSPSTEARSLSLSPWERRAASAARRALRSRAPGGACSPVGRAAVKLQVAS